MSLGKIGIAGLASLVILLGYIAVGAMVYRQGPSPLETVRSASNGSLPGPLGPYRGLVSGVSNATYQEESEIEGTPQASAMRAAVRVDGMLVIPMPGAWRASTGDTLCHWQVADIMARASKVDAKGYVASWYIPGEGRSKVLVAEKVEAKGPGWELEAEHLHGSHGCAGMHHGYGGMGHGMGHGYGGMMQGGHEGGHDHDEDHDSDDYGWGGG